ncbi:hypothetical protein MMC15_005819 [Xylographa vitiligo]|nr:hypothetical protein [Xylographa vitiligo]
MSKSKPAPADAKVKARTPVGPSSSKSPTATPLANNGHGSPPNARPAPPNSAIDGVSIVASLQKPTGPEILLQRRFRPLTDKVCIEVPAGLIDAGETAEECAVWELREETGYVGVAQKVERVGGKGVMFNGGPYLYLLLSCGVCFGADEELEDHEH